MCVCGVLFTCISYLVLFVVRWSRVAVLCLCMLGVCCCFVLFVCVSAVTNVFVCLAL